MVVLYDISLFKLSEVVLLIYKLDLPPDLLAILLHLTSELLLFVKSKQLLLLNPSLNHVSHLLVLLCL